MTKLKNPHTRQYDTSDFLLASSFLASIVLLLMKLEWYLDIPWIVVFSPIFVPVILAIFVVLFFEIKDSIINKAKDEVKTLK
jgi:hypothetical protein